MAKTKEFELQGFLIGDPKYPDAKPGDILKLEVGDDDLPTSVLLRSRVRPLGDRLDPEGEMTDKEAKGKAGEIIKEAKEKAAGIVEKAQTDAAAIVEKANADAAELIKAAGGE